jgi:predicted transcriptional regulator
MPFYGLQYGKHPRRAPHTRLRSDLPGHIAWPGRIPFLPPIPFMLAMSCIRDGHFTDSRTIRRDTPYGRVGNGLPRPTQEKEFMSLIRRVRPQKTGIRAPLGDLEQAVMRCLWDCGHPDCQAADVQQRLAAAGRPAALTTVLTTLDRLYEKGIVRRERVGKAYRYAPAVSEEQLQQRIVAGVLGDLIAQFPKAVATYFAQQGLTGAAEEEGSSDPEALAELARRLERIAAELAAGTGPGRGGGGDA